MSSPATPGSPVLDLLAAVTRAQHVVRAFAAATNLVVAGTQIEVRGEGAAADALLDVLDGLGARTVVVGEDLVRLLRHHLRGRRTSTGPVAPSTTVVLLVDVDLDLRSVATGPAPLVIVTSGGRLLDGDGQPVAGAVRTRVRVPGAAREVSLVEGGPSPSLTRERARWQELGGDRAADAALAREVMT